MFKVKPPFILAFLLIASPVMAYQRGSALNEGDLDMQKYSIQFDEVDETPSCPPADEIKVYSKDNSGTTAIYTLDSACSETLLGSGGGGSNNLDGGRANEIYLLTQVMDGGNATSF